MHPILFKLGPFTCYSYGLMLAVAYLVSSSLAARYARRIGAKIHQDQLANLFFFTLVGGIVGARVLYIAINWDFYSVNLYQILRLDHGGLVWYGGFLAGFLVALFYLWIKKIPFLETADLVSPYLALAHSIGRIGCFLNGCCFGKPTHSIFGVYFPNRLIPIHPTQLYSSIGLFVIFLALLQWRKRKRFTGEIGLAYLFLYSLGRFGVEFLRGDSLPVWSGLTLAQLISIPLAILSGALLFIFRQKKGQGLYDNEIDFPVVLPRGTT